MTGPDYSTTTQTAAYLLVSAVALKSKDLIFFKPDTLGSPYNTLGMSTHAHVLHSMGMRLHAHASVRSKYCNLHCLECKFIPN